MNVYPRFRMSPNPEFVQEIGIREVSEDAQDLETPNILIRIRTENNRTWDFVVSHSQLDDLTGRVERHSRIRNLPHTSQ